MQDIFKKKNPGTETEHLDVMIYHQPISRQLQACHPTGSATTETSNSSPKQSSENTGTEIRSTTTERWGNKTDQSEKVEIGYFGSLSNF